MNNRLGLVDTNILVYSHDETSPHYEKAKSFLETNLPNGELVISPQNLTEYYSVVTNHKNPSGVSDTKLVCQRLESWTKLFRIIIPTNMAVLRMIPLLEKHSTRGSDVHDFYLAATMMDNDINTIYTADTRIFKKLGLKTINPLT